MNTEKKIQIILANPRGFCAGVVRAVEIVEKALKKFGAPIYVRHEIVHNKFVVEYLKNKGAIFVDETHEIPENAHGIFSAHGVSDKVEQEAKDRNLQIMDATCPLVTKVHKRAVKYDNKGYVLIIIGHAKHPEIEGTSGRVSGVYHIVKDISEIRNLPNYDENQKIAYIVQTTLSVIDTKDMIDELAVKYPHIEGADTDDICYATQNRQTAVLEISPTVDVMLIVGATNSSNSNRLYDLAKKNNPNSYLIAGKDDIDLNWFSPQVQKIGISSGASSPDVLIVEIIDYIDQNIAPTTMSVVSTAEEDRKFNVPPVLMDVEIQSTLLSNIET